MVQDFLTIFVFLTINNYEVATGEFHSLMNAQLHNIHN